MAIAKDFVFFGRLCLDFAHTGDMGYGSRFERLTSPGELQRWLSLSLVNIPKLRVRVEDLQRAKALRKAILLARIRKRGVLSERRFAEGLSVGEQAAAGPSGVSLPGIRGSQEEAAAT